jgi:tetratricopeptide (TPR) repeat protein
MAEAEIKELKKRVRKHGDDSTALTDLVGMLRVAGKYDQAVSYLERYVSDHPDDFRVLITYGEALLDLEAYEDAIGVFRRACEIKDCAESHYNLARAYDLKGMHNEAIKEHNRATEIEPECSEAHYRLGMTYARRDKQDDALLAFQNCLKYDQSCAKAHSEMALVYERKGIMRYWN